eukprot:gene14586-biopygen583
MAAPQAPPGSKNEECAAPQALPGFRTCKPTTLCSVLFCYVLFCSVLFCSALFCSVLVYSVLPCATQPTQHKLTPQHHTTTTLQLSGDQKCITAPTAPAKLGWWVRRGCPAPPPLSSRPRDRAERGLVVLIVGGRGHASPSPPPSQGEGGHRSHEMQERHARLRGCRPPPPAGPAEDWGRPALGGPTDC